MLYKWKFNPYYDTEYDKTEANINGQLMYLIPIAELSNVTIEALKPSVKEEVVEEIVFEDGPAEDAFTTLDENIKHMTIKDAAAILWKRPVSEKAWLNELINQINK
jgi:hypothetical protein